MALFEYRCGGCTRRFERISSYSERDHAPCPHCGENKKIERLISRFAVGGQGDLRESTFHGCHDCHVSTPEENHSHSHDDSHSHSDGGSSSGHSS